jgi:hypothetical protein
MLYHMHMDRESFLKTSSILDLLAIGWRPGDAELTTARHIEHWAILPGPANRPYQIIGMACLLPVRQSIIIASLIAIDPKAHWARIWDEWIVLDERLAGAQAFDPDELLRAGADWLLAELGRLLPAH